MPQKRTPRSGSLQYWPRKRARKLFARVRTWAQAKEIKLLGFAGYKAGMTHLVINDNRKTSTTKGMSIFCPATIIECPPLKTLSIKFYKNTQNGPKVVSELMADNLDKELKRKLVALIDVKIEGNVVTVTGIDKELVAQTAASIEKLTDVVGKDLRIYQDGIYITNKDGKEIS